MMRRAIAVLAVFVAALAYFLLFRDYGFQVEDEGTLLFQLDRASRGQLPYTDFGTGYTPGFFAAGAALLRAVDHDVAGLRTALAVLHAASAAILYVLAGFVAGRAAVVAPFVWVLLLPVFAGGFASFNIPYPAWLANVAWLVLATALVSWSSRPRLLWLFFAGVAAAGAFAVKPNAGAFAMAGAVWALGPFLQMTSRLDRAVYTAGALFMACGVWFAFEGAVVGWDVALFLFPCLLLAFMSWRLRGRFAVPESSRPFVALATLAAGFLVPTLIWVMPTLGRLGVDGFLRDVLFLGSGAAALFKISHPAPELIGGALVLGTAGFAVVSWWIRRGIVPAAPIFLAAGVAISLATWQLLFHRMAPEGLRHSLLFQLENALTLLAPLVHLVAAGLVLAFGRMVSPVFLTAFDDRERRHFVVLSVLAAAMYLQIWPRVDFMHFVMASPLSIVVAIAIGRQVAQWWSELDEAQSWARHTIRGVVLASLVLVAVAKLSLILPGVFVASEAAAVVKSPRLTYSVEAAAADTHRAMGMTMDFLSRHTEPGEEVLGFPAVSAMLYALGLSSPVPHDYWYPGRPDKAEEAQMLEDLQRDPPRVVVTLNERWVFFPDAPGYFRSSLAFAKERYRLAARYGRFDVLLRKDLPETTLEFWQPVGPIDDVFEPSLLPRQQAAARWLAGLTVDEAIAARLPGNRTHARLLLRALRDVADMKAASWLVAGVESGDPLLETEARHSMRLMARAFEGVRFRWAGDFDREDWRPWLQHLRGWALAESDSPFEDVVWFARTILFVVDNGPEPVRPDSRAVRATDAAQVSDDAGAFDGD